MVCLSVLLSFATAIMGDDMLCFYNNQQLIKRLESSQYGGGVFFKKASASDQVLGDPKPNSLRRLFNG